MFWNKTKEESLINKTRLSSDEYAEIYTVFSRWLKQEEAIIPNNIDKKDSAYYNIATFNLCRIGTKDVENVFFESAEERVLSRFSQLYLHFVFRLGKPRVDDITNDIIKSLIALGVKDVESTFADKPYLVIIPMLNIVAIQLKN